MAIGRYDETGRGREMIPHRTKGVEEAAACSDVKSGTCGGGRSGDRWWVTAAAPQRGSYGVREINNTRSLPPGTPHTYGKREVKAPANET